MPVIRAMGGLPSVVNPLLAGPTRRKTDVLDARLLAHHSITGLWPESFMPSPSGQQLRILWAQRADGMRTATRCGNRLNNIVLRFGHTFGADSPIRSLCSQGIIEELVAGSVPALPNVCPDGVPEAVRPGTGGVAGPVAQRPAGRAKRRGPRGRLRQGQQVAGRGRPSGGPGAARAAHDCAGRGDRDCHDVAGGGLRPHEVPLRRAGRRLLWVRPEPEGQRGQGDVPGQAQGQYPPALRTASRRGTAHQQALGGGRAVGRVHHGPAQERGPPQGSQCRGQAPGRRTVACASDRQTLQLRAVFSRHPDRRTGCGR